MRPRMTWKIWNTLTREQQEAHLEACKKATRRSNAK